MDARYFDMLVKALAIPDSRRRLLALLATLPAVGGLLGILEPGDAGGKGRRKRRKKRHKHGKGRHRGNGKRKKKQRCKPESVAETCAGKCGSVPNNCQQPVDCGSCDCSPACAECFTCQGAAGAPGTCVPQAGTPCGAAATCQSGTLLPRGSCNGSGVCEAASPVSCAPYTQCAGDACATTCAGDGDCVAGSFCDNGACVGDLPDGEACAHGGQCASGFCVEGVCCDSACAGDCESCTIPDVVGTCTTEIDGTSCGGGNQCCSGSCQACCDSDDCSGTTPICEDGSCVACSVNPSGCPGGACCDASSGTCAGSCPASDPVCVNKVCTPCSAAHHCPAGCCATDGTCKAGNTHAVCGAAGGTCRSCAVEETCCAGACVDPQHDPLHCGECGKACGTGARCVAGECCYETTAAFQAALADPDGPETIRLCAGAFTLPSLTAAFRINRRVRIIGAGDGEGGTILAQGGGGVVVSMGFNVGTAAAPVQVERVAIAHGGVGVSVLSGSHVAMTDCTVRDNRVSAYSQGVINEGTLTMTRCQLRNNGPETGDVSFTGGGLYNDGQATLIACCVTGNRQWRGGGIYNFFLATLTLTDTRVIGNSAIAGGGLYRAAPSIITIEGDTVLCNNSAPTEPDCWGFPNDACGADPCPGGCTG
ncbi:MAG: hypothetical protein M3Z20_11325 [Chloroflexota bacterium]|nr:hypothetical protein [Chloroflexota bacterium]